MKSRTARILFLITLAAWGMNAQADGPYIGLKSDRVQLSIEDASLTYSGLRATGGYKVTSNVAVEAHIGTGVTDAKIAGTESRLGAYYGVDLKGRLPVTEKVNVSATLGYGSIEIDGVTDTDLRYGIGAGYQISSKTEVTVSYERWYSKEGLNIDSFNVGVNHSF